MKDSCDAIERPCGLDRPVVRGPGAWTVTATQAEWVMVGGRRRRGDRVSVEGPSEWEVGVWGQEQSPLFPTTSFCILPAQFLSEPHATLMFFKSTYVFL